MWVSDTFAGSRDIAGRWLLTLERRVSIGLASVGS
jgi:hypothetical protein